MSLTLQLRCRCAVPVRPSKLDPFADKLSAWLRVESKKSRKQKRIAKQLYVDLVELGYDGSYNRDPRLSPDAYSTTSIT